IGGWLDRVVMRSSDIMFAFPAILVGIAIAAIRGSGVTNVAIAVAIFNVPVFARVARAGALQIKHREYIEAAVAYGARTMRVIRIHAIPKVLRLMAVQVGVSVSAAVLLEAGLSFLGLGAQPPEPSWGNILSGAQRYLREVPLYGVAPGFVLTVFV